MCSLREMASSSIPSIRSASPVLYAHVPLGCPIRLHINRFEEYSLGHHTRLVKPSCDTRVQHAFGDQALFKIFDLGKCVEFLEADPSRTRLKYFIETNVRKLLCHAFVGSDGKHVARHPSVVESLKSRWMGRMPVEASHFSINFFLESFPPLKASGTS